MTEQAVVRSDRVELSGSGVTLVGDRWSPASSRGTVVLLHGGGQTRHSWSATGDRLAAAGWSALSLDTRGHGDSEWAPDQDYGLDALVDDLRAVLATLPDRSVLVGASMGGTTSLVAEGEHPGLSRGLVLVDIVPRVEPEGVRRITDFMTNRPEGFASLEEVAQAVADYNPHRKRPPSPEGLRKNVRLRDGRWFWHWDPAFLSVTEDPGRPDRDARVKDAARRVSVPTMLVRGEHSDIVSDEGVAELLELIPGARYVDVGDTGHMVAGDDNDVFSASLTDFIERL